MPRYQADDRQALTAIAASLARTSQAIEALQRHLRDQGRGASLTIRPTQGQVLTWDDPFSEPLATSHPRLAETFAVLPATFDNPRLDVAIDGSSFSPGRYESGTEAFRYWIASEALARGIAFWSGILPAGTTWSTSNPMGINLNYASDLNARYSRLYGLRFYHSRVRSTDIYTAASADVVCHELGHAILDAIKPQLFHFAGTEPAAFHEAFGDLSALFCALQIKELREQLLTETEGSIQSNSRFSRIAEQLGWALRMRGRPVDDDSLRNLSNRFYYQLPDSLPPSSNNGSTLSAQPHSFSRIFSGAVLEGLAYLFRATPRQDEAALNASVRQIAEILIGAIIAAPVSRDYYSQVAATMVQASRTLFDERHAQALSSAFVGRGILSPDSSFRLARGPQLRLRRVTRTRSDDATAGEASAAAGGDGKVLAIEDQVPDDSFLRSAGDVEDPPLIPLSIDGFEFSVHWGEPEQHFDVNPQMAKAAIAPMADEHTERYSGAHSFVEGLIARGDLKAETLDGQFPVGHKPGEQPSHELRDVKGKRVVKRISFACRCGAHH